MGVYIPEINNEEREMDRVFKKIFAGVIGISLIGGLLIFLFARTNEINLNLGETNVGEDVIKFHNSRFATGDSASLWSEKNFIVLTEGQYKREYPDEVGLDVKITIPDDAENVKHFYQFTAGTEKEERILHDEVFLWETPYSGGFEGGIIYTERTTGNVMLLNDRGYVELTITKDIHPLCVDRIEGYGKIPFTSVINNRVAAIGENEAGINGTAELGYQAVIKDFDGNGTNCYIIADGVNREYFVYILQKICGKEATPPSLDRDVQKSEEVLGKAKKKIEIETAAIEFIKSYVEKKYRGSLNSVSIINNPLFFEEIKKYNDINYNITVEYAINYLDRNNEVQIIMQKHWMLIENRNGRYQVSDEYVSETL